VRLALGPGFEDSVSVLRVFAFWIPLIALSTVRIFQVLLPNHLDNQFNLATFTSALVSIAAAVLLAPSFGAVGSPGRQSSPSSIPSLLIPSWRGELA
jgi:O-antigen/teichoic acid export membrane protein